MQPNKKLIREHLDFLFKDTPSEYQDGRIEIAYTNSNGALNAAQQFGIDEIEDATDFVYRMNKTEANVYVGAALRSPDAPPFGRSDIDDYYAANAVWADIDDKEAADTAKLKYQGLPPSLIVVTGRHPATRFQAWWKLAAPEQDKDILKQSLSGLRHALDGDPSVVDAIRVMRVGGSVAWPKKKGRVPELTEVVTPEEKTEVVDIERVMSVYEPKLMTTETGRVIANDGKPRNIITGTLQVQKLLEKTKEPHQWNTNMRDAIAAMIGKGWSDEQILMSCASYADNGAQDEDVKDLLYRGRVKFNKPNPEKFEEVHSSINEKGELVNQETGEILPKLELKATSIDDIDLDNIPPRAWLFGNIAARKFVTMIGASAGAGKSIFTMQMGIAAAAQKPFGTHTAQEDNIKVWVYNNEEGEDELKRRLKATMIHWQIDKKDLSGNFYMDSGESRSISIARRDLETGGVIHTPEFEALKQEVTDRGIDMLIVDPFAETHDLGENSNDEIKRVAGLYREIALHCNCAVILVHHTRKGGSNDSASSEHNGNADNLRGAGAQIGVVRRVFTMARMDSKTAKAMDVPQNEKRWYVRLDDAKTNITAPAETAEWYKFKSISICNGSGLHKDGDSVGVMVHKTVEEIESECGDQMKAERVLLLQRLARIMIMKKLDDANITECVKLLFDDGYKKYKERYLKTLIPESVEKIGTSGTIVSEGYQCKMTIEKGQNSRRGNLLCLKKSEISNF